MALSVARCPLDNRIHSKSGILLLQLLLLQCRETKLIYTGARAHEHVRECFYQPDAINFKQKLLLTVITTCSVTADFVSLEFRIVF